jgi:hypothetical protein
MDDPMQASLEAHLEVERRLHDFARGRLSPSAGSKARSRARVMREARLVFANRASGTAVAVASAELTVARARSRRAAMRRATALLAAAVLSLIAVGGALAASGAGGPLYPARVWIETITLPSEPGARAAAELTRLESRMSELEAAVRSGDRAAVSAALAAYEQIADEALAGAGTDQAAIDKLLAALDRHVAVLERVVSQVPAQAAESITGNIEKAINHNDAAIQRIDTTPNGIGPAGGGTGAQPGAAPTAKPEPTPMPEPTPRPTPKASPPGPTPHPTAAPAGGAAEPTPKVPPAKPTARPDKTPPSKSGG